MLKQRLTHPQILESLASAGHGARILIADGNYPASTQLGENADLVYLNFAPGKLGVPEILDILQTAVAIEDAAVMDTEDGIEPSIFQEFRSLLPGMSLTKYKRYEFYEEASGPDTCLVVVSGEQRVYANILLTIGVTNT